jgi:hypothetical protein
MPAKNNCPNCEDDTRQTWLRVYSGKFNAYFCNVGCYDKHLEEFREMPKGLETDGKEKELDKG